MVAISIGQQLFAGIDEVPEFEQVVVRLMGTEVLLEVSAAIQFRQHKAVGSATAVMSLMAEPFALPMLSSLARMARACIEASDETDSENDCVTACADPVVGSQARGAITAVLEQRASGCALSVMESCRVQQKCQHWK